jgi:Transmembrane secretion effector
VIPLWRNREFVLLQAGQLFSTLGTQSTVIAYPLLVLALTGSPAKAGLVSFARLVPGALFALPAGLAADRWNRRRMLLVADSVRALAIGSFAVAILVGQAAFWQIPLVAFVEGVGSVLFGAAHTGALRAVVPRRQLPAAVAAQEARGATVRLVGPPLGGALFGVGRAVPFVVDAVSYAFSFTSLALMRTPFQEERELDRSPLRAQLAEGFRFLWSRPFLRTCAFLYALGNFTIPGVLLVVVVVADRQGLSAAAIGALFAVFGASTLLGSLASPLFRRSLSVRAILLLELWAGLGVVAFLVRPSVYVLLAAVLVHGFTLPITDSVVVGYRIALTPDRLLGRVEGVRSTIGLAISPLGPLAAGLLLSSVSARATIAFFLAFSLALALWGTLSPSIRNAPSLDELDDQPDSEGSSAARDHSCQEPG